MKTAFVIFSILFSFIHCKEDFNPIRKDSNQLDSLNSFEILDLFSTEMNPSVSCYRIPSIITAPNGTIIAAIDERVPSCADLRANKNINIVARFSEDNGKTWSDIQTIVDFPEGQSASDPSMILDKTTNEIFLFYNYMDLNIEKDIYYFHYVKSKDNGKTWSKPIDITKEISLPGWEKDFKFITSGRGIQTESGQLLHCLVNIQKGLHVFGSDDHGRSWYIIQKPITPADESKIIERADGSWMINSRVSKIGKRFKHLSNNQGQNWKSFEEPQLPDPACNASIIRFSLKKNGYPNDIMLFSNANSSSERKNMSIKFSYDEGENWSEGLVIYQGSAAYSSMTILPNGNIGLFFEKDDYSKNSFVSIHPSKIFNNQ